MNEKIIAEQLRIRLGSIANLPTIITENVSATMQPTLSYLREFVLFGDTFELGLAADGPQRQDGIYQVDVCVPKNQGRPAALDIVEKVKAGFQRQAPAITVGSLKINLEGTQLSSGRTDGEHFVYSLSIRWTVVQ